MRVLFAGGGTGGHLFPAIALADGIKRREPGTRVLFVGTSSGVESKVVPKAGYDLELISMRGFKRGSLLEILTFPFFLLKALWRSFRVIRGFEPDVVVGTGGYVSGPVVFTAALLGIPTLIQEQNSYPGLTTRLLARWVDQVHLSFSQSVRYFKRRDNLRVSGNPIRADLGSVNGSEAKGRFGLDGRKKTVLIVGGSQGAHSINMAMLEALGELAGKGNIQVLWQTGRRDYEHVKAASARYGLKVAVEEFIDDMASAYGAADMAVCRAGATTIAEITRCGLPAILIPYPFAAADHQLFNARTLVEAGAAKLVFDHELNGEKLAATLMDMLIDQRGLATMAEKSRGLGRPEAAKRIVDAIFKLARR